MATHNFTREDLIRDLPPVYSTENLDDPIIKVKLFNPVGASTWYLTEASMVCVKHEFVNCPECPKPYNYLLCFGVTDLYGNPQEMELGYIHVEEIMKYVSPMGTRIERDTSWTPITVNKLMESK